MFVHYREPELEELLQPEVSQQWLELAESLGMEGQLSTVKKLKTSAETEDSKAPIPYMRLNKRWLKIMKTLCPDSTVYNKYKFSTIPLDGLAEIGLCKEKNYFEKIEIWFDNLEKDPLIVGSIGNYSDKQHYLIGRFGDEVLPFEELERKALQRLTQSFKNKVEKISKTIDETVKEYLDKDDDVNISVASGHSSLYW
jgi:hypothetical protein